MANIYEVEIPNVGTFEVESDKELTDQQAYNYALIQSQQEPSTLEQVSRKAGSLARGLAIPTTGAILGGSLAGPPGAIAGSLALPAAELVSKGLGAVGIETGSPYELAQRGLTKLGFPEPQTTTERALQAGGEALGGVGGQLSALSRLATTATTPVGRGIATQLSTLPERQLAASVPVGAATQAVTETSESPLAGTLAGVATALPFGIKAPRRTEAIPTITELKRNASALYKEAEEAGIVFKKDPFQSFTKELEVKLKKTGLDKDVTPTSFAVLNRIKEDAKKSNTLGDIDTLRKVAKGAASSTDNAERNLGRMIIEELDNFVETADPDMFLVGNKKGIDAIKNARESYKMAVKAETLDDIFNVAELRASANFTQSGMEQALRSRLVNLAVNKKKMRAFTQVEQQAIRETAKGGSLQNFYRAIGKYAPTSSIPTGIGAGLGASIGSTFGLPGAFIGGAAVPAIGGAARKAATDIGLRKFKELEQSLRLGRQPRLFETPRQVLGTRGLLIGGEQEIQE
jgi:hypothetical protein